jgi:hypothetical protein
MRALLVLALIPSLSGCATLLTRGPSQLEVAVEEPQSNIEVLIEGTSNDHRIRRKVPFFTVSLDRKSDYVVTVKSPGHQSTTRRIGRSPQPSVLGNLLMLGLGAYGLGVGLTSPNERIERLGGVSVLSLGAGLTTGGLVGLGWDVLSGAFWQHQPSSLTVTLEPDPARPIWPFW